MFYAASDTNKKILRKIHPEESDIYIIKLKFKTGQMHPEDMYINEKIKATPD